MVEHIERQTKQKDAIRAALADCEEFITLRAAPSTSAEALTTIPKGGQMTYISASGEFTYVEYQGQRGYVLTSYIARAE